MFNRTGDVFRDAFGFARLVGVKTCLGTEAPMVMPKTLQKRLTVQGKNPADPDVVREVYEGMFRRIMAAHPLDYYWLWTPESWTWRGNTAEKMTATMTDVNLALEALKKVDAPFRLATCGCRYEIPLSTDRTASISPSLPISFSTYPLIPALRASALPPFSFSITRRCERVRDR